MGQNQSAEKPERQSSRSNTPQTEKERKVNRRTSLPALSHGAGRQTVPSASATTAVAQGTTSHNSKALEEILQTTSAELTPKTSRGERSSSRASRKQKEHERVPLSPATEEPDPLPTGNIDIPALSTAVPRNRQSEIDEPEHAYPERTYAPVSHHRPPRLPLPIADEPPDSPSLLPVDRDNNADVPLFDHEDSIVPVLLPRRNSMQSVDTQDEDEVAEELQPYGVGFTGQTVPTLIEWHKPAEKVFVTGTFAAWDKKYRLRKTDSDPDKFKTIINLPPGTHHLKFYVDNQMITSEDLPTAVDFNNILVNYIEISTDDLPKARRESASLKIPASDQAQQQEPSPETYSGTATPGNEEASSIDELPIEAMPEGDFRQVTPQALTDIDLPEDDHRYKQAAHVIQDSPAPPSLPLFLSRSILNGNTPVKDDSSVLTLPNHTVLNHLMTSSVRNGVLATSVTTRYKKKYVTTISFKPIPRQ